MQLEPLDVQSLVGEKHRILVIDGHVDLARAQAAFLLEGGEEYPAPEHAYMHWTDVPDGEFTDNWRAICRAEENGAEPVTVSVLNW